MANYNKSANTYIRCLYSPGFSSLMMSFFKTNLIFNFVPYAGKDKRGFSQYSQTIFLSTSVNYESAAFLYLSAMSILNGKDEQVEAVLQCSNNAAIIFEYKLDEGGQMTAYLVIDKNNETIPFRFSTHQYQVREHGQMVTKVIQSGLGVFVKTLEGYLTGIGADLHLCKLSEDDLNNQQ